MARRSQPALVHWSATEGRFRDLRRAYAALLSTLTAWALCSVPWLTATCALLELAALDVLLVSLPGSPVRGLDAIATRRRAAGEPEMPGLTFKRMGLVLGLAAVEGRELTEEDMRSSCSRRRCRRRSSRCLGSGLGSGRGRGLGARRAG